MEKQDRDGGKVFPPGGKQKAVSAKPSKPRKNAASDPSKNIGRFQFQVESPNNLGQATSGVGNSSTLPGAGQHPDKITTRKGNTKKIVITVATREWYTSLNETEDDYFKCPDRSTPMTTNIDTGPVPECLCYLNAKCVPENVRRNVKLPTRTLHREEISNRAAAKWLFRYPGIQILSHLNFAHREKGKKSSEDDSDRRQLYHKAEKWLLANGYIPRKGIAGDQDKRLTRLIQLSNSQLFYGVVGDVYPGNKETMTAPYDPLQGTGPHPDTKYKLPKPRDLPLEIRRVFHKHGRHLPTFQEWKRRNGWLEVIESEEDEPEVEASKEDKSGEKAFEDDLSEEDKSEENISEEDKSDEEVFEEEASVKEASVKEASEEEASEDERSDDEGSKEESSEDDGIEVERSEEGESEEGGSEEGGSEEGGSEEDENEAD